MPIEEAPQKEQTESIESNIPYNPVIPQDIPSALLSIIAERGSDVLTQSLLLNILDDYHLFRDNRALKNSLKQIQNGGYISTILKSSNWELDCIDVSHRICNDLGIQSRYSEYLVASIGYGLGFTDVLPEMCDNERDTKGSEDLTQEALSTQQTVEYDPHSELQKYILPKEGLRIDKPDSLFQVLKEYECPDNILPVIIQDKSQIGVAGIFDLTNGPHILIGGATLTGKSVLMHSMIASLLFHKHPSDLKLVLIDGKGLEFGCYENLNNHFLAKRDDVSDFVITDYLQAISTLNSLVIEIDNRMALLKKAKVRNIKAYNKGFNEREFNPSEGHRHLPYLVVFIDEFSTFYSNDFEKFISVIGSKGAPVGIHMVISTSQVEKNTVTLQIRQQFPQRIAFKTLSISASRLLLNNGNSAKLSPRGNAIWGDAGGDGIEVMTPNYPYDNISDIVDYISKQSEYGYPYILPEAVDELPIPVQVGDWDPLLEEAARYIVVSGAASTSSLQRQYCIGYNRAGKIMDQLERLGIVGPAFGGKPRCILVDNTTMETIISRTL